MPPYLRFVQRDDQIPMLLTLWDEQGNGIDSETATDGDAAVRMAINLLARKQTLRLSYQLTVAIWDDGAQR
jgi:hypothetical protein